MNEDRLKELLDAVASGALDPSLAWERLKAAPPTSDMDFATIDHHREWRCGHPEIVYAPGKTPDQAAAIAKEIAGRAGRLFVSRASPEQAEAIRAVVPRAGYDSIARAVTLLPDPEPELTPGIALVSAGTADQHAAREAELCCRYLGHEADAVRDVGVAGIHRLLAVHERLRAARVVVVVAGMEGALASVVGGLVDAPVVAVPTSVGYGAGSGGIAALLSMLNSCASNVSVVNIDNGVGAAVVAAAINRAILSP
jgi:NCAIR mutase (PurE)-related protein